MAAEQQARRRRRLQDVDEHMPRQPGGGRRRLLERAARSWVAKHLPDLELTAAELGLVEEFVRDDPRGSPYDLRRNRRPAGCTLSRETWLRLRDLVQRQADEPRRRMAELEEERRRVALAEHPGAEYLGGGMVRTPDGHVVRSSATASNDELRSAIVLADDAATQALVAQARSLARLASLVDDDGAGDEFQADERQRENLAALARMAAELRSEERARRTSSATGDGDSSVPVPAPTLAVREPWA
jgi:hypothetical protein